MILVADIGNTTVTFGLISSIGEVQVFRCASGVGIDADAFEALLQKEVATFGEGEQPYAVAISSVVPKLTTPLADGIKKALGLNAVLLTPETATGMTLDVREPETVGSDRIASALGAIDALGAPVVVCDFGTATTVNFIESEDGKPVFRGGAILPGVGLMARALSDRAAMLPEVEFDPEVEVSALGRDTVDNIRSGIIYGTAGAVQRIIAQVESERLQKYKLAVTGGNMHLVLAHLSEVALVDEYLLLRGLESLLRLSA